MKTKLLLQDRYVFFLNGQKIFLKVQRAGFENFLVSKLYGMGSMVLTIAVQRIAKYVRRLIFTIGERC
ncbi:hypothetical protein DC498_18930 [Terrimonas sp.]|uniref:hypothetical protein n=1 Tax=Terrimonas sp. TaxID=1914338 RepID=UPI000D51588D|nr:hypothetical protein [Terrimonas sp.]PVD50667.1 hypothetical protein DC498_18930 [Terrimonas sp.]